MTCLESRPEINFTLGVGLNQETMPRHQNRTEGREVCIPGAAADRGTTDAGVFSLLMHGNFPPALRHRIGVVFYERPHNADFYPETGLKPLVYALSEEGACISGLLVCAFAALYPFALIRQRCSETS